MNEKVGSTLASRAVKRASLLLHHPLHSASALRACEALSAIDLMALSITARLTIGPNEIPNGTSPSVNGPGKNHLHGLRKLVKAGSRN
jgi:hypothetical protein